MQHEEQTEEIQELSCRWNDGDENITVNGDRYRAIITDNLFPEIEAPHLGDIWFQQYGATSHTSHQSMDLLGEQFGEQIFSRFGLVNWPPRSYDIAPLFIFMCVRSKVSADNPAPNQALEQGITSVIRQLLIEMPAANI